MESAFVNASLIQLVSAARLPGSGISEIAVKGNAGGGKDPDFWRVFEDGEPTVIGDEPDNTDYDPGPSEKASAWALVAAFCAATASA